MHAVDIYGLSEVMGPGVAQECVETKDGLHVWEDHFYPEVVDPVTGEVLPDGEKGELVFTSLTKQAMPVIRYRTRDLTRLLPGTARPMRRMEKVTGRTDDMIILRGVNLFPTQIEELILRIPDAVAALPVRADAATGRLDAMTVRVERRGGVAAPDDGGRAGRDAGRPGQGDHRRHRRGRGRRARTASSGRSARCAGSSTSGPACGGRRGPRRASVRPGRLVRRGAGRQRRSSAASSSTPT